MPDPEPFTKDRVRGRANYKHFSATDEFCSAPSLMYEDLNQIAQLKFNKEMESISRQTRDEVRDAQNDYAALTATDDTHMPMQAKDKSTRAYMWVYIGDDDHPYNIYDFRLGRSRGVWKQRLAQPLL